MTHNYKSVLKKGLKWTGIVFALMFLVLGGMVLYWFVRPNLSNVDPNLGIETWVAVDDGLHNSNTDMIYCNGTFYLVHQNSIFHLGSGLSKLIIWNSTDARTWQKIKVIATGEDIRDPKFAIIGSRLYLYVLKNYGLIAEPSVTFFSYTNDNGTTWADLKPMQPTGWLFWRPKTRDNITWYVPAYWHEHGRSVLLNSTDGENWTIVSQIWQGELNDETAIEFLPDGRLLATARLEGYIQFLQGDNLASTLIAVSAAPFESWNYTKSSLARLDGPYLFSFDNKTFAVARFQPDLDVLLYQQGSFFSRKRTALYLITEQGLIRLSDLPSAGDTSYAGVVIRGDEAYISYYSSPILQDFPWVLGVLSRSAIYIVKVNLTKLSSLADRKLVGGVGDVFDLTLPWVDYIVFFSLIAVIIIGYYVIAHWVRRPKKGKSDN